MTTSAATLQTIILNLSQKYDFDNTEALSYLASEELLPNKLIPKSGKVESIFASKKAKEMAEEFGITPEGEGSAKNGKFNVSDIELLVHRTKKVHKMLISPNALNLANENNLSLTDKIGTGKDGRIVLKDVEKWISEEEENEEEEKEEEEKEEEATSLGETTPPRKLKPPSSPPPKKLKNNSKGKNKSESETETDED
jgi:pyruvate/2-oxoglutarate dehydrogenase complex dihydrolipoamide acyltransferase (E2) component